jgi:hypothetical protein
MVTGGAVTAGGSGCFFLQPATATKATSRTTGTRMRLDPINGLLLPQFQACLPSDLAILSPRPWIAPGSGELRQRSSTRPESTKWNAIV